MNESPGSRSTVLLCPQTVSAFECVCILSQARAGRKFCEQPGIPSSEHHIVSLRCGLESLNDLLHVVTPFRFPVPIQSSLSHIMFIVSTFPVRQVCEFHGR